MADPTVGPTVAYKMAMAGGLKNGTTTSVNPVDGHSKLPVVRVAAVIFCSVTSPPRLTASSTVERMWGNSW